MVNLGVTASQPDTTARSRGGSQTLVDNFNSSADPIAGTAASGTDGLLIPGQSTGGRALGENTSNVWASYWLTPTYGPDLDVWGTPKVVDAANGGHAWIDLRIQDPGSTSTVDCYEVELHRGDTPDHIYIWKTVNGVAVQKAIVTYQWVDGYRLRAAIVGNTINVYVDNGTGWALVLTYTDSSSPITAAGKLGIGGRTDATLSNGGWDDLYASGLVVASSKYAMVI
jgi:hypothetical protein